MENDVLGKQQSLLHKPSFPRWHHTRTNTWAICSLYMYLHNVDPNWTACMCHCTQCDRGIFVFERLI